MTDKVSSQIKIAGDIFVELGVVHKIEDIFVNFGRRYEHENAFWAEAAS